MSDGAGDRWEAVSRVPALEENEVQVWQVDLDLPDERLSPLAGLLDAGERARAERFRFDRHRNRYIVAHAALRRVLGDHLGLPPQDLRFAASATGKPHLIGAPGRRLHFNLAHSGSLALIALTGLGEVGVDVEWTQGRVVDTGVEEYFSAGERALLAGLPDDQRRQGFFTCWVRKEAAIKAWGLGLAQDLAAFEVLPAARIRHLRRPGVATARWAITDLVPAAGYVAALVVAADDLPPLRRLCWQGFGAVPGSQL